MTEAQLQELYKSGDKYRKELLVMPLAGLRKVLPYMTLRKGIRGKETVGEGSVEAELRPYRTAKGEKKALSIVPRTLETFLGDVVIEEDPHLLSATIWGDAIATAPEKMNISKEVALMLSGRVGKNLYTSLFTAKRNATGETTKDLFNGFSTIVEREIAESNLTESKRNYADVGCLNRYNVVDKLMELYLDQLIEELQDEENCKMFVPTNVYNLYNRGYQDEFGHVPFNKEYRKTFLEGTDNKCELVPLSCMKGTGQIITTVKRNLLLGCDQESDVERVRIREVDNPKIVQFFMKMFFGVEFESVSPERFCAAKFELGDDPDYNGGNE